MFRESQTPLSEEDEEEYTNELNESLDHEEGCPNGFLDHEL